jgi:sensor histidine kinase regulating citrate/malate metabolism
LGFAKEGRLDLITEYLKDIKVDIEKITPKKYCENETVNLILSSYGREAEEKNIEFVVDAKLPVTIPLTDTELCSVLSNALENAFNAVLTLDEKKNREIQLRAYEKNEKLCIEAKNRYGIEPVFIKGLPVSNEMEHGFGTKSMANIIRNKEGVFRFYTENGWFIFQAVL